MIAAALAITLTTCIVKGCWRPNCCKKEATEEDA